MTVTPERLREFFAPRSLAVVGASDTSGWAQFILAAGAAVGFDGPLIPVHPRHATVFGRPAVPRLRDAYRRVLAAAQTVPGAVVDGVLVTPMRAGGVELLVGVTVDRTFGPVLAVGLGGLWVELLADTSLRVLPVSTDEVKHMLGDLRGGPLLRGARGSRPADLDALAQVIRNVADAALSIPDGSLHTLEINPLWVNGDQIEALDVLVVTNGSTNGS